MNIARPDPIYSYELAEYIIDERVRLAKLYPDGIMCLNSALYIYGYTDRIPETWQIAVDKYTAKTKFDIPFPKIKPIYVSRSYLEIGVVRQKIEGIEIKVYDKERTICDCLRYQNKMDAEVFNKAIKSYLSDADKNIGKLLEYGKVFKVTNKIKTYVGVWL